MTAFFLSLSLLMANPNFNCPAKSGDFKKELLNLEKSVDNGSNEELKLAISPFVLPESEYPFIEAYRTCAAFYKESQLSQNKTDIKKSLTAWKDCLAPLTKNKLPLVDEVLSCSHKLK